MNLRIANCKVVSPDFELNEASMELEDGIIKNVSTSGSGSKVYDASGLTAVPGFIDMHFHGAAGCDVTDGDPAGIVKIAGCKLNEGVTSMVPTTLTLSEETLAKSLKAIAAYMAKPTFCKVPGVHLEGPFISNEWKGAQNPDFIRKPDIEEVMRLDRIAKVLLVSFAIEAEGGIDFVGQLRAKGIVPSCGHSGASFQQFKEAHTRGLRNLTHFCNQMSKFHHREIGLVGAGLYDDGTTLELICDRLHLSEDMVAAVFKFKSPSRIALITDSLCTSWMGDGEYSLGGLKVQVKDGESRLASNNALAGSNLKFNFALRNACQISGKPLKDIVRCSSLNQAETLGLKGLGRLEPGYRADITLLDDAFNVRQVFIDGIPRL